MRLIIYLFFVASAYAGQDIAPLRKGDDVERITEVLGPAKGSVHTSKSGILFYDRGEVHTRHGKVSHIFLISKEELASRNEEEKIRNALRRKEGEAQLTRIKDEGEFQNLSGHQQVAFWESFRKRYPDVDIQILYQNARDLARKEAEKEAEEQRIARLERRVLEAELRAAQAAEQAAQAQKATAMQQRRIRITHPAVVVSPYGFISSGKYLRNTCGTRTRNYISSATRLYPKPAITWDTSLVRISIR